MIHISLFSGIGGFELAAEWMGWRNWVSCDINEFGNKVREYYWPNGYCHKDVKTLTYEKINKELSNRFGSGWRDDNIIITGGFPCQPYSSAGKRLGKEDERHLWPEMLRVISEVKPTYIVGENVRGLTNWNGGVVFEEVCADLENLGYEVQPVLLPACAIGAPHRRDRIWFVANRKVDRLAQSKSVNGREKYKSNNRDSIWTSSNSIGNIGDAADTDSDGQQQCDSQHEIDSGQGGQHAFGDLEPSHGDGDAANTNSDGQHQCDSQHEIDSGQGGQHALGDIEQISFDTIRIGRTKIRNDNGQFEKTQKAKCGEQQFSRADSTQDWWRDFPSQSPVCGGDDGLPTRLDSITFSKWRNESIKAYGNAIVPQVAYQIFKALINK